MKNSTIILVFSLIASSWILFSCHKKDGSSLILVKELNDYPSASGVEYLDGNLYAIGDDANNLLILDTNLNIKDSISLYSYPEKRIPKNIKPDLEAVATYRDNTGSVIFLFGSGSLSPYRNTGWWYYIQTNIKDSFSLKSLYQQIKDSGIAEINIEGACFTNNFLILASRGNKGYPKNHLVFIEKRFWEKENNYNLDAALIGSQDDPSSFRGVSGLSYYQKNDWLIATVSTENTKNSVKDGPIGKSYLWIIKDIDSKESEKVIKPDKIIDLETTDHRFKNKKIESACITSESGDFINLVLVGDNDNGSSTIFKMQLRKD